MSVQVDLSQLATPRAALRPSVVGQRGRFVWITRYLIPLILLAGFVGTLTYTFRESFWSARPVTVVPVMAMRAEVTEGEAAIFQSAGWVEPRPTPVIVSALDEGVVEKLLVTEGQELDSGAIVAQLIDADAKLRLLQAEADLTSRLAELESSKAALTAAEIRLREPIELQIKLAEAEAMLAETDNELARLPGQIVAAQSRLELAETERNSRAASGEGISKLMLARSISEFETATAALSQLDAQQSSLAKVATAHQRRVAGLRRQLELKTEEQRQRDEAKAAVEFAQSRVVQARIAIDAANLSLSRMTVRTSIAGKVLALVARPGSKVMGLAPAAAHDASTVITMYDPKQLQIRADVRLEDVPSVTTGQLVRIETAAIRGGLKGRVIAATSLTDIQKNTLQVKVAVDDPPPVLKPDMLVQVTFLSRPSTKPKSDRSAVALTLVIPPQLVRQDGNTSSVWIADREQGIAQLRVITLGGTTPEGLREVRSGLAAGDRLIASGFESLRSGDRVQVVGEAQEESQTPQPSIDKNSPAHHRL